MSQDFKIIIITRHAYKLYRTRKNELQKTRELNTEETNSQDPGEYGGEWFTGEE